MNSGDVLLWQILLLFVLVLLSAFFSCAEIALIALNKTKLEKKALQGSRGAKRILALTSDPSTFLATIQVGNTLTGFLASAIAASTISGRLSSYFISLGLGISAGTIAAVSMILITVVLAFVQMVIGELVPKRVAMKKADALAFPLSGVILIISRAFAPMVWLLTRSTNIVLRLLGIKSEGEAHAVTEEEIRMMIDVGSARGIIKDREKEILHNVFEFDNRSAAEVMTHRREVVLLYLEDSDDEWERIITTNRHSFFPVFSKKHGSIAGVLTARDYLMSKDRRRKAVMTAMVNPAQLVPTTVRTDILFARMKKTRNHFAIVLDEHGSMMGIVTMKDLLEELVGNLDDDSSRAEAEPLIVKTGSNTWIINGALSLDRAARELGLALPDEHHDTFGGFVFSLLGRIPEDGTREESQDADGDADEAEEPEEIIEGVIIEDKTLSIRILEVREHRLEKALVTVRGINGG